MCRMGFVAQPQTPFYTIQLAFKPLRAQQNLYHHRIGDIRTHAAIVLKGRYYPFLHPLMKGGSVDNLR